MSLEVIQKENGMRQSIPSEHEMMVFNVMAKQAVASKMYKGIGDEAGVMMIMLAAREMGIPPMAALNGGINIIQGKAEISARMMNALIRKAGHQVIVKNSSDTECTLVGKRCDTGEMITASFSVAEAQKAGLVKQGGGWTKWPKDMCFARALSRLARQLFSDVIGIGYVEGEIRASDSVPVICDEVIDDSCEPTVLHDIDDSEIIDRFIALFEKEERYLAHEYLRTVMKHFDWTASNAIKILLEDQKRLFDKFNVWKNKQKKPEEV